MQRRLAYGLPPPIPHHYPNWEWEMSLSTPGPPTLSQVSTRLHHLPSQILDPDSE